MKKKSRDILFLCQFFYPEYNSSATLPFDTAKYLASVGFSVDALVGYPREYSNDKHLPLTETVDGVGIRRIKYLQLSRVGRLGRLINYFSFTLRALLKVCCLRKYKVVIVYSNPPILPIVPILARTLYGTKFIFVSYDVYPEVAYASQALTPKHLISRLMRWINKSLYGKVECVVALTDEMREFLLENRKGLSSDRIVTIPNWAHEDTVVADHEAYERFGFRDHQFVVSYFGNMGICQDIETMLNAAELLRDDERVRFLIVGHGNKTDIVKKRIQDSKLTNVQFHDFLTGNDFLQAVAVSSCCIVSLENGLRGMCAPSKVYSYLKGGHPVLAVVEKESYLAEVIKKEQIGFAVEIGNAASLRDSILSLVENSEECKQMGNRAKTLYEEKYSYEVAMAKYLRLIQRVI